MQPVGSHRGHVQVGGNPIARCSVLPSGANQVEAVALGGLHPCAQRTDSSPEAIGGERELLGGLELTAFGLQQGLIAGITLRYRLAPRDQPVEGRKRGACRSELAVSRRERVTRVRRTVDRAASGVIVDRFGGTQRQARRLVAAFGCGYRAALRLVARGRGGKRRECGPHARFLRIGLALACVHLVLQSDDRGIVVARLLEAERLPLGAHGDALGQVIAIARFGIDERRAEPLERLAGGLHGACGARVLGQITVGAEVGMQPERGKRRIEHAAIPSGGQGVRLLYAVGELANREVREGHAPARWLQDRCQPAVRSGAIGTGAFGTGGGVCHVDRADRGGAERREPALGGQCTCVQPDRVQKRVRRFVIGERAVGVGEVFGVDRALCREGGIDGGGQRPDRGGELPDLIAYAHLEPRVPGAPVTVQRRTLSGRFIVCAPLGPDQPIQQVRTPCGELGGMPTGGGNPPVGQRRADRIDRAGIGAVQMIARGGQGGERGTVQRRVPAPIERERQSLDRIVQIQRLLNRVGYGGRALPVRAGPPIRPRCGPPCGLGPCRLPERGIHAHLRRQQCATIRQLGPCRAELDPCFQPSGPLGSQDHRGGSGRCATPRAVLGVVTPHQRQLSPAHQYPVLRRGHQLLVQRLELQARHRLGAFALTADERGIRIRQALQVRIVRRQPDGGQQVGGELGGAAGAGKLDLPELRAVVRQVLGGGERSVARTACQVRGQGVAARDPLGHQRLPRTSGVRAHQIAVILRVVRALGVQERLVGRIDRAEQSIEHPGVLQPIGIDRVLEVLLRIREYPMPPGQRPLLSAEVGLLGRDLLGGAALQLRDRCLVGALCPTHRVPGGDEALGGLGARVAVARGVVGVANHRARDRALVVQHRDQCLEAVALLLDTAGVGQPPADAGRERPDPTPRLVADVAELPL